MWIDIPNPRNSSSHLKLTSPEAEFGAASGCEMRKLLWASLVIVGALTCAVPAVAQSTGIDEAKLWFAAHDRNHDGYITLDEVMGYDTKLFKRMDTAGDGRLREDQYCAGIPSYDGAEQKRCHSRCAQIDADQDAYITLTELQDFYRLTLQAADQKGDGRITLDEWLAVATGK